MNTFNNQVLLPLTTYGTPSGNYDGSSTAFFGNAIPAANYYQGQGSAQTAMISSTGFLGVLTIEASLNDWTEQAKWFTVTTYGNATVATTETVAINMEGNFVWLRAKVTDFTAGSIDSANVIY